MSILRRLLRDTSGGAITDLVSFTPTWFVLFSVFLMNVQLGRNYEQRDMVDHAAALAADTTMKTICDNANGSPIGALTGPSMGAVNASIQPLFQMVSSATNPCQVKAIPSGDGGGVSGAREVDVEVTCRFPCTVPLAAQLMCSDGYVTFSARHKTVAMGCDAS